MSHQNPQVEGFLHPQSILGVRECLIKGWEPADPFTEWQAPGSSGSEGGDWALGYHVFSQVIGGLSGKN